MVRRIVSEADSRLLESGRNDSQLRVRRPFCVPRIVIFLLQGRGTSFFPPPPPQGEQRGAPRKPPPARARLRPGGRYQPAAPAPRGTGRPAAAQPPPALSPPRRRG